MFGCAEAPLVPASRLSKFRSRSITYGSTHLPSVSFRITLESSATLCQTSLSSLQKVGFVFEKGKISSRADTKTPLLRRQLCKLLYQPSAMSLYKTLWAVGKITQGLGVARSPPGCAWARRYPDLEPPSSQPRKACLYGRRRVIRNRHLAKQPECSPTPASRSLDAESLCHEREL
jgi:hypothetical protein